MYSKLFTVHSLFRWLVLISLLYAIYRAYAGWLRDKPFTKHDNAVRHWAATIAHIQLILGLCLYFISPLVTYFLQHFKEAIRDRELRFFGMEHITMMVTGITLITIGSVLAKRKPSDKQKFKTMAIWFTLAMLIILSSVPWSFSPVFSRPLFRMF